MKVASPWVLAERAAHCGAHCASRPPVAMPGRTPTEHALRSAAATRRPAAWCSECLPRTAVVLPVSAAPVTSGAVLRDRRATGNRFSVIETHPAGGTYDCITLLDRNE